MLASLEASVPLIGGAGWDHGAVYEIANPYISFARAKMARKALEWGADVVVFIDHDVSWKPSDLLKLIETEGDVVAGTYRFKSPGAESYMGALVSGKDGRPIVRADGCLLAETVPAGFLKLTRRVFRALFEAHPELVIGNEEEGFCVDLFNHGAYRGVWWGEDYAFSRRWRSLGGEIWVIPDLDLDHHNADGEVWKGNFHRHLLAQPGGSEARKDVA